MNQTFHTVRCVKLHFCSLYILLCISRNLQWLWRSGHPRWPRRPAASWWKWPRPWGRPWQPHQPKQPRDRRWLVKVWNAQVTLYLIRNTSHLVTCLALKHPLKAVFLNKEHMLLLETIQYFKKLLLRSHKTFQSTKKHDTQNLSIFEYAYYFLCFDPQTMDTQRGNSLHCTAENSIPIPNF